MDLSKLYGEVRGASSVNKQRLLEAYLLQMFRNKPLIVSVHGVYIDTQNALAHIAHLFRENLHHNVVTPLARYEPVVLCDGPFTLPFYGFSAHLPLRGRKIVLTRGEVTKEIILDTFHTVDVDVLDMPKAAKRPSTRRAQLYHQNNPRWDLPHQPPHLARFLRRKYLLHQLAEPTNQTILVQGAFFCTEEGRAMMSELGLTVEDP